MSQPTAHQTMINNYNPHWFMDSIASHHVNGDLNNLALYQGVETENDFKNSFNTVFFLHKRNPI